MVPQPVSVEVGSLETGFTGHPELVKVLRIPWFYKCTSFGEGGGRAGAGGKSNKQELLVMSKQCAFLQRKKKDPPPRGW